MKLSILKTALIFSLILAGGFWNFAMAIDESYAAPQLRGNQIRKDSFSVVSDTVYFNPALKPLQTTFGVRNLISLRIKEDTMMVLPDEFNIKVYFKVYYKKASGSSTVSDSTGLLSLEINYNKSNVYNYRAIQTFTGGYEARVVIKSIENSANLAAFENAILLENEIFVNRSYQFSCTNNVISSVSFDNSETSSTGELKVGWGIDRAADEYDLEWTYIDDSALADYKYSNGSFNSDAIFLRNASRVSITSNQYLIPLLYDTKGRLFFRVRSVQIKTDRQRVEANWSSVNTAGLGEFPFNGHGRNFNWQASTSFAEEGKRKSVVQYFDGSLRGRQTVTKDNTTNRTIIAENFYDFQGRPVIQVLPSPSMSNIISYTPRFNSLNGAEYDKSLFDKEAGPNDICEAGAPALDSAISGAAHYYSSLNPLTSTGIHQYIPKSYGFPFTEVRYLPDNTGRVSMQSGVGPAFQIGQHATRFYYGTADQEELDALFGTDVGINTHYYKNMVRDANGQYSISYVDMFGRTIATALAGNAPDSMQALASNDSVRVVKNLLDASSNIVKGTSIESSRGLIVTKRTDHRLKYSLVPDSLSLMACNQLPVCYDCKYDLEITITDECGKSIVIKRSNVGVPNESNCGVVSAFPAVDTTFKLEEGNYTITKKLTINNAVMEYYKSVFLSRNTCKTYDTFLVEQKAALDSLVCELDCSTCKMRLGTRETFPAKYFTALNVPQTEWAARSVEASLAYNRMEQECEALCGKSGLVQNIRDQMLMDLTPPSGQYANPDKIDQFSIFKVSPGGVAPYQSPGIVYYDARGVREYAQTYDRETFINRFQPTWAEDLLQLHPEYRKLMLYEQLEADSRGWEEGFQNTETFHAAVAKGFLNPAGLPDLPSDPIFDFNIATADSMFVVEAAPYIWDLKEQLDNMSGNIPGIGPINAWSLATIMAHCKSGDLACLNSYKTIDKAFDLDSSCSGELDFAWKYFRGFYLQARRKVIQYLLDQEPYVNGDPSGLHRLRINFNPPVPNSSEYPYSSSAAEAMINDSIAVNCDSLATVWLEDLKPCNMTENQRNEIITRMKAVCKEGGDMYHIFGASTVKPSSTLPDRSFEQIMRSVLGSNYNSACNVYLITAPRPYENQPEFAEKEVFGKPDSCDCERINATYSQYINKRNGNESFSQYLYRTSNVTISAGALDTLRKSCNGELACNFYPRPIKLPTVLQCNATEVCVDCNVVLTHFDRFKFEFKDIIPAKSDTGAVERAGNRLFAKYMNYQLGFSKTSTEYLDFIDQCTTAGKSCKNLERIRLDYKYIPDYDSTRFYGYGDPVLQPKLRETYYGAWAHMPDSNVNTSGWGRRYGKLDTLCVGNVFTIVTRIKRPARDTSNTIVDLNISFNQDGHLQKIAPIFYFLKKSASGADSAFVRANSNRIGYSAVGDTIGQLSQKIPDFTTWKIIKITHTADNYWRLYYNDTLVAERHIDSSVRRLLGFNVGFQGKADNGYVDYFKIYDGNNVLRYNEEFEDHIQSVSNAPVQFRCEDKCQEGFVKHFNRQMGTLYNYAQIDSVYAARSCTLLPPCGDSAVNRLIDLRNEFRNEYYNFGLRRDVDNNIYGMWNPSVGAMPGLAAAVYPYRDFIKNGIVQAPDTLNKEPLYRGSSLSTYKDTICISGGFGLEMKMKFDGAFQTLQMYFKSGHHVQNLYVQMSATLSECWIDYIETWRGTRINALGSIANVTEFHNLNMSEWTTIKWKITNQQVGFYVNGVLRRTFTFPPDANFQTLTGWAWGTGEAVRKVAPMAIDWVKYYDGRDSVILFEDFNDPENFARLPDSLFCMRKPCDETFEVFFNKRQGYTDLSLSQISQLYASKNVLMDICDDNLKLCGRNEPLFPVLLPKQHQACDDSTLFAVSAATILHEFYRDSLLNSFDDRYLAKCLAVKNTEQFTVEHSVNEYHYTLYYYDQAGNLVRTVPPSGVDVSKFKWAVNWSDSVKNARIADTELRPNHKLPTDYRYNTLNQVVEQKSPDGGRSEFWYDRLGRLAISQNAKQRNIVPAGRVDWNYSYTKYDNLGRIAEVGEVRNLPDEQTITPELVRDKDQLALWHIERANNRSQITTTLYDIAYDGLETAELNFTPQNLRNRLSASFISEGSNPTLYNHASFYTYDIHGNVNKLLQDYGLSTMVPNIMNRNMNRFKLIEYDYDLISGKVNMVRYQPGWADQFYHRYRYDAENRLTLVETSLDGFVWQKDARYEYYLHGPLARTVLGDQSVQGVDYAYTLQGWLKGVNSSGAGREHDMGGDGKDGSINKHTARDAYGFALNYYIGDYQPSNGSKIPFPGYYSALGPRSRPLYNGNISSMASTIRRFEDRGNFENGSNLFYTYKYDQLNRLVGMDTDTGFNIASNSYPVLNKLKGFNERITYDANGNIQKYLRNSVGDDPGMDDLTYTYYPGTNQLRHVGDKVRANKWGANDWDFIIDIDSQAYVNNYVYDSIGNLVRDSAERIWNIKWNVYGKIEEINKYAGPKSPFTRIRYSYDASGNRIGKMAESASDRIYEWYVRDAQGNILSVYNASGTAPDLANLYLSQVERNIYGSSRLGSELKSQGVDGGPWNAGQYYTNGVFERGRRQYELSNHLGNVLTTISDKKFGVSSNGSLIDYYEPHMVTGTDYYPFGMPMRFGGSNTGQGYRFGFNGKENDNEVKWGMGNQLDYGFRIYDPRIAKFLSVDPLTNNYPWNSPYSYAEGNPINYIDLDGLETPEEKAQTNTRRYIRVTVEGPPEVKTPPVLPRQPLLKSIPRLGVILKVVDIIDNAKIRPEVIEKARRAQAEKDAKVKEEQVLASLERHTLDPSTLSDDYLKEVDKRISNGTATAQDWLYTGEIAKRRGSGGLGESNSPKKIMGLGLADDLVNHRGSGAVTWRNAGWQQEGWTKVDFGKMAAGDKYAIMQAFQDAAKAVDVIRFDVTNFDPSRSGITQFEFQTILGDPTLRAKTQFIKEGKTVTWDGKKFVNP